VAVPGIGVGVLDAVAPGAAREADAAGWPASCCCRSAVSASSILKPGRRQELLGVEPASGGSAGAAREAPRFAARASDARGAVQRPIMIVLLVSSVAITRCVPAKSFPSPSIPAAAGFRMELADTAERQQQLRGHPAASAHEPRQGRRHRVRLRRSLGLPLRLRRRPQGLRGVQRLTRERQIAQEEIWTCKTVELGRALVVSASSGRSC